MSDERINDLWKGVFGKIAWRNHMNRQREKDKRDALIYETRKRLKKEGWIR